MFSELDDYLKEFEMDEYALDYWYDEGFSIAQDMLSQFIEEDWKQLKEQLSNRSLGWKRRLGYCLHDYESLKEIEILCELIDTEDDELFEIVIDSLRSHNIQMILNLNVIKQEHLKKIESKFSTSNTVEKKVMGDFLSKLDNGKRTVLVDSTYFEAISHEK